MQIRDARKGIATEEMKFVAKKEGIDLDKLMRNIASGKAIIFKNAKHDVEPVGLGNELKVKVNANIGTSMILLMLKQRLERRKLQRNMEQIQSWIYLREGI